MIYCLHFSTIIVSRPSFAVATIAFLFVIITANKAERINAETDRQETRPRRADLLTPASSKVSWYPLRMDIAPQVVVEWPVPSTFNSVGGARQRRTVIF